MWGEEGLVVIVRRSIEYLTAMINGPARLKVMADRPTHTCIPGNRRLSVPADKTGSRAPSYTPHRGPTYVRTSAMQQHGVAWSGVAIPWYARWLTLMHARSICCYKTDVPGITLATLPSTCAAPEEHVCPYSLPLSLPPCLSSCTTRELIPDFSHFVLFCYFVVSTSVDKRWSNWDIVSFFFSLRWKDKG